MHDSAEQISQILSLENGKGLKYLIGEAYYILGNPLVLFNMEYELLCCTENVVTDDWLWNEIVETGVFSDESIKFFQEECFIDVVASTKSVALLTSDKLKYDRLYGRVFNKYNNTVADLIMVECDKSFEAQDSIVFKAVCKKLSQEISMNEFFNSYGVLYDEKLICELLNADIDNKVIYSGHISNLYEGLKMNLYVVVIDVSRCNTATNKLEKLRDLFKEMQPELKYAVYSNYIVIIASTDDVVPNYKRDLYKLIRYFNNNNICTGISSCFENLFNLRKYYKEAVEALSKNQ